MRKNFVLPENYDEEGNRLQKKVEKGESLTKEEALFCTCIHFDKLLFYPFCLDQYFSRVFIARTQKIPKELLQLYPIRAKDHFYYEGLVREWGKTIHKTNHKDQLLQVVSKETRDELKNFRVNYSFLHRTFSSREYSIRKFKLLEWSKYRYIMIKEIFDLIIKSDHYKLYLNGQEIIFNYYSLTHILTRHFGHIMKPYETDKDHFTKDVHHEEIHLMLEDLFKQIDESKLFLGHSIEKIHVRLNGTPHKIFVDNEYNGAMQFLRLNSFFPIVDERTLNKLKKEFEEKEISYNLSLFVKKIPS